MDLNVSMKAMLMACTLFIVSLSLRTLQCVQYVRLEGTLQCVFVFLPLDTFLAHFTVEVKEWSFVVTITLFFRTFWKKSVVAVMIPDLCTSKGLANILTYMEWGR